MIVYLHGFRSSPASRKARVLSDAVAALPAPTRPVLHVPELTDAPAAAIAAVLERVHELDSKSLSFVGSSLGGFYATHLAERLGARAVLVNPAVRPYDDLRPYAGAQVNLYTGAEFEVTERHFEELRALADSLREADRVFCYAGNLGWDAAGALAPLGARAHVDADLAHLVDAIAGEARDGDHVLVMSNGGFGGIHDKLLARLAR